MVFIVVIVLELTHEASDEIGSWNISVLSMGPFGYCSHFVRGDNMKRRDEIGPWNISVVSVGSFGFCSYLVRGENMKRLMK